MGSQSARRQNGPAQFEATQALGTRQVQEARHFELREVNQSRRRRRHIQRRAPLVLEQQRALAPFQSGQEAVRGPQAAPQGIPVQKGQAHNQRLWVGHQDAHLAPRLAASIDTRGIRHRTLIESASGRAA